MTAARPLVSHVPCHIADQDYIFHLTGQNSSPVLEQYRSLFCDLSGKQMMSLLVKYSVSCLWGVLHKIQYTIHTAINFSL